jgi:hypothetical protein
MPLLGKGSKFYSISRHKCPRCQEGDLFLNKNPYDLKMLDKMPATCGVCGLIYTPEVGFYYGAMMISHALTVVMAVIVHLIVFHFYGWEVLPHLISLITVIVGLFPIVFRTARAIWINIFVKYKGA